MPCPDVPTVPAAAATLHRVALVVDLHAHPSLKTALFGLRLERCHAPGRAFNPLALRCDLPKLVGGGVNVLCSAVYVPEAGLLDDCPWLRYATALVPGVHRLIRGDPCSGALQILRDFEHAVAGAGPVDGLRGAVARSRPELDQGIGRGDVVFVHTLEGAHHLAGDAGNVARFADRGVAMLTLAHFYPNGVAPPVDGIPPGQKHLGCFRAAKDPHAGLTPLGRNVVAEMMRVGMLVDLTHSTPPARREVLDAIGTRAPVVMSHVGAGSLHDHPMNPSADEVRRIADTGGVVGVIAMDYWLGGPGAGDPDTGTALMVRTVRALADQGGIEAVALGTDFDGFTDPPDDVPDPAALPRLTAALLDAGLPPRDLEKILGENALRVLREGWGRVDDGNR